MDNGRRGRDRMLTPDWAQQGVYRVDIFGERIFVAHRFKQGLRAEIHPPARTNLTIEMNFPEIRATIKHRDSHWQQRIILLFPGSLVGQPSPYKHRRCDISDAASSVAGGGKSPAAKSTMASSAGMDVAIVISSGSGLVRAQSEMYCPAICDQQPNEGGGDA